LTQFVETYFFS